MPFQSEKQRRYLHANHPEIANRWEAKYGLGGIAELNSQLNQLPEYYLPKNQGGLIPSHEAGIYGLNEGGVTDIGFSKVKPSNDGSRPGYFTAQYGGGDKSTSSQDNSPGHPSNQGSSKSSSNTGNQGSDQGHSRFSPGSGYYGEPKTTTKSTPDDSGDDDKAESYVNWNVKEKYTGSEDLEEQLEIDKRNALTRLKFDPNLTKDERQSLEVGLGFRAPTQAFSFGSFLKNAALTIIPGLLPAKLATAWKVGSGVYNYQKGNYDKYLPTDFKSEGKFATHITNTVKENAEKMKTHQKKMDLYKALPDGHPEKIALSVELEIGKKTTPDGPDGEGVKHPPTDTSITIDNIEEVNKKKMELASTDQLQVQKDVDRSKRDAYLAAFRQKYLMGPTTMAAGGGRIPQGYNTGGLSNLFRLKNR